MRLFRIIKSMSNLTNGLMIFYRAVVLAALVAPWLIGPSLIAQDEPAKEAPAAQLAIPLEAAVQADVVVVGQAIVGAVEEGMAVEGDEQVQEAVMVQEVFGVEGSATAILSKIAAENALVRRVCKLSPEQLESLKQFDSKWVKKNAKVKAPNGNLAANVIRMVIPGAPADQETEDPFKVLKLHQTELKKLLNDQQLAAYETAVTDRRKFRTQANVQCIVALLDERLNLSQVQREQISEKLTAWKGLSNVQPNFYFQNTSYIPTLPADVKKVLNDSQRKALQLMNEADIQFSMFGDGEEAIVIDQ